MKNRFSILFVLLLGLVLLAPTVAFADGHATLVRVAHLSPDAPAVDIWVNDGVVLSDVPYKAVSDYLELPSGSHRIRVTPTGESEPVVIDATVEFESDKAYTVAATGFLGEDDLQPLVLVDDRFTMMNESKIRFVHTSPDAPAVDVGQSDGSVVFGDVAFRESSTYAQLPAGSYDLEVRVAGTMDIALSVPGVMLEEGTNYTVFAIGSLNEGTLEALPVVDAS
ncbi:DUF4397 domain-containing protein [Candidatus Bipolaricaulota bacterium]|nr:DUF4397 domain-containing protein [Candidatus Bipolaricaulota bacterium]